MSPNTGQLYPQGAGPDHAKISGSFSNGDGLAYDASTGFFLPVDLVSDTDPRLSDARTPTAHDHDSRYYTETEIDTALAGKASTSHNHDSIYPRLDSENEFALKQLSDVGWEAWDANYWSLLSKNALSMGTVSGGDEDPSDWQIGRLTSGSGWQLSLVDAKGDLLLGTANNAADRLPVGANDTVLMADSAQSKGAKWADAATVRAALDLGPACAVYNTGNTTLSGDTLAVFGSELFDTDGLHSTVSNTHRLTASRAGKYWVWAAFLFQPGANGYVYIRMRKNGSELAPNPAYTQLYGQLAGTSSYVNFGRAVELAAADYVEFTLGASSNGTVFGTTAGGMYGAGMFWTGD